MEERKRNPRNEWKGAWGAEGMIGFNEGEEKRRC